MYQFVMMAFLVLSPIISLAAMCIDTVSPIRSLKIERARDRINYQLRKLVKENKVSGVTYSVFNIQGPILASGVGTVKYDSQKRIHPDRSLMRTASVSKLITSMTVLKLVSDGHLDLDTKILDLKGISFVDYLLKNETPDRLKQWNQITVRHLMNHQAGISKDQPETLNGFFNSEAIANGSYALREGFLPSLLKIKFLFEPGLVMKYSNMGPNLLARIVEGTNPDSLSFDQYVKKSIFEPLGILNSTYDLVTEKQIDQFVSGYTSQSMGRRPLPAVLKVGGYDGSIGVASTAHDLAKFGIEILRQVKNENPKLITNQNLISEYYTASSFLSDKMVWGLGPSWVTLSGKSNDQPLWLGHMGTGPDMRSVLIVSPELGIGVSLIANAPDINRDLFVEKIINELSKAELLPEVDVNNQLTQSARHFMQTQKHKEVQPLIGVKVSSEKLRKFVGTYIADIVGPQKMTLSEDGHLVFYGQKLVAIDPNQNLFSFPVIMGPSGILFNKEPVKFELDQNGNVISVTIAEGKIFKKIE